MVDFTYTPDKNKSAITDPATVLSDASSGIFEQRDSLGNNNTLRTWKLTFKNRSSSEGRAIAQFLESKQGYIPFTFIELDTGNTIKVISPSWTEIYVSNSYRTVTATFEEIVI